MIFSKPIAATALCMSGAFALKSVFTHTEPRESPSDTCRESSGDNPVWARMILIDKSKLFVRLTGVNSDGHCLFTIGDTDSPRYWESDSNILLINKRFTTPADIRELSLSHLSFNITLDKSAVMTSSLGLTLSGDFVKEVKKRKLPLDVAEFNRFFSTFANVLDLPGKIVKMKSAECLSNAQMSLFDIHSAEGKMPESKQALLESQCNLPDGLIALLKNEQTTSVRALYENAKLLAAKIQGWRQLLAEANNLKP